jgi:hypothetical protein
VFLRASRSPLGTGVFLVDSAVKVEPGRTLAATLIFLHQTPRYLFRTASNKLCTYIFIFVDKLVSATSREEPRQQTCLVIPHLRIPLHPERSRIDLLVFPNLFYVPFCTIFRLFAFTLTRHA